MNQEEQLAEAVREIGRRIGGGLPPGVGFALVVFSFTDPWTQYVSNGDRAGVASALRELAERLEEQEGLGRKATEDARLYPVLSMSSPRGRAETWAVPLWDAIHDYVRGCGGDPRAHPVGVNGVTLTTAAAKVSAAVEKAIRMGYAAAKGAE